MDYQFEVGNNLLRQENSSLRHKNEPLRYADTDRNKILNRTSTDLENIINGHDPEIHNLGNRVWDRLDKMALEIEAHAKEQSTTPAEPGRFDELAREAETAALHRENKALREALEFYADRGFDGYDVNITDYGISMDTGHIIKDAGDTARARLDAFMEKQGQ